MKISGSLPTKRADINFKSGTTTDRSAANPPQSFRIRGKIKESLC